MYPKFVITADGEFRLGMVTLHKHLLEPGDVCLGGGYYEIDYTQALLILSGESTDYGRPQWAAIGTLRVSATYRNLTMVYYPGSRNGYAIDLDQILTIEYT